MLTLQDLLTMARIPDLSDHMLTLLVVQRPLLITRAIEYQH
jgi:hypothetical protein